MSVIKKGRIFANGEQLTAEKLNVLVDEAEFNSSTAVDNSTIRVNGSGAITVKPLGITSAQLANGNVTFAKLTDVIDDDTMATASDTTLATSESIKAYVNGSSTQSSDGYVKLPNGIIIQWGSLTPSDYGTDVTLPIAFPNNCWNVQTTIGGPFTDSTYTDNSLIWGGFPKDGDLSKIVIMSNLRINDTVVTYQKMFWQAIGN
jgi:hypothetical protein